MDVAILGVDGKPKKSVSLDIDSHSDIVEIANEQYLMIARIRDYYEDAEFSVSELTQLRDELFQVLKKISSPNSKSKIIEILAVIDEAKKKNQAVHFIAD